MVCECVMSNFCESGWCAGVGRRVGAVRVIYGCVGDMWVVCE